MSFELERSPEQIQEYFDLLEWREAGSKLELPPESIETEEYLIPINNKLSLNEDEKLSVTKSISSDEEELKRIENLVSCLRKDIKSTSKNIEPFSLDIKSINRDIESINEKIEIIEKTLFNEKLLPFIVQRQPQLLLDELIEKLIIEINTDLKSVKLYIFKCFKRSALATLIISSEIIIVGMVLGFYLPLISNSIMIIILSSYIFSKIIYVNREYKKESYKKTCELEINKLKSIKENKKLQRKKILAQKQNFERIKTNSETKVNGLELQKAGIKSNLESHSGRIIELQKEHMHIIKIRRGINLMN